MQYETTVTIQGQRHDVILELDYVHSVSKRNGVTVHDWWVSRAVANEGGDLWEWDVNLDAMAKQLDAEAVVQAICDWEAE